MRDNRTIVDEYQKGDAEKRLNLFMECPSLRDEFVQMEQVEASQSARVSRSDTDQGRRRKPSFYYCKRLFKLCNLN